MRQLTVLTTLNVRKSAKTERRLTMKKKQPRANCHRVVAGRKPDFGELLRSTVGNIQQCAERADAVDVELQSE